jgi:hypothetical protein
LIIYDWFLDFKSTRDTRAPAKGNVAGQYDEKTNLILINKIYVDKLEAFNLNKSIPTTFEFFMAANILHEFMHFGNLESQQFIKSIGKFDVGDQFEDYYYGGNLDFDDAGNLIFKPIVK